VACRPSLTFLRAKEKEESLGRVDPYRDKHLPPPPVPIPSRFPYPRQNAIPPAAMDRVLSLVRFGPRHFMCLAVRAFQATAGDSCNMPANMPSRLGEHFEL
jgi:hypothetical protein